MKLRIGSRMRVGFFAMTGLLLIGGLLTILYTYRLQHVTTAVLDENLSSLKAAQELEVALFRMRGLTSNYLLDGDARWLQTLEERKLEFRAWLAEAHKTALTSQEETILSQISSLVRDYETGLQSAIDLNQRGDLDAARRALARASRVVFEDIYIQCEAFVGANEGFMIESVNRMKAANKALRMAMYGLGIVGVLLGYFLGSVITRSIEQPIYELVLKVRGAAGDELVERMDLQRDGGLEQLDRQVHELIHRINTTRADLERNRRLLSRAEQLAALGKVSAGIAHEIRNPLTAIKMLVYSMREDSRLDDDQRRDLEVISKEIVRMERFVESFLDFARPPDPKLVPMQLSEVAHETVALLLPRLQQSGTRVLEVYEPETGHILADPDQIRQVVMNLILNAVAAMPEGGEVRLETQRIATTGAPSWVHLRVTDTGTGIPDEILDDIFEPFVSGREDGSGLGLSISSQIVRLHGGWIDAANNPHGGATLTVSLPEHAVVTS